VSLRSPLYAVVDDALARRLGIAVPALAAAYLSGGARLLQLRCKDTPSGPFLAWCDEVVEAARRAGATVIVNDRADLARLSGAAGVHVGQEDLPVPAVRRILAPRQVVGLSTHSAAQIERALALDPTYIAVGPVFGTTTKHTGYEPVGLELVRYAARVAAGRPVVAIGGITLDRAAEVLEAGAASVAVIADLLSTGDPEGRVRQWLAALAGASSPGSA
jgi:thiamine-phosphate pyrophosphorylase